MVQGIVERVGDGRFDGGEDQRRHRIADGFR